MDEAAAWIALGATRGVGGTVGQRLVARFGPATAVLAVPPRVLADAGFAPALARRLATAPRAAALREAQRITTLGARVVSCLDAEYPVALRQLPDAPLYLLAAGRRLAPGPSIAVVGARHATPYGRDVARRLGADLAQAGLVVVSGLARGIDAAAHEGALQAGGLTVAVLGAGIDRIYPPEHRGLASNITARGTLLTERPLGSTPRPGYFPARNRIIAGMTVGTVVVEAAARSGALITARLALDAGREVFAVPGRVDSAVSAGPHALIQDGAKLVRDVDDVLEELRAVLPATRPSSGEARPESGPPAAPDDPVLACLAGGPLAIDRVVQESGLSAADVLVRILELELLGLVRQHPGQRVELSCKDARLPGSADSVKG